MLTENYEAAGREQHGLRVNAVLPAHQLSRSEESECKVAHQQATM